MDLSQVSIVVLSHNRRVDLEKNLEGLLAIVRLHGAELVIVDNASSDGSVELIKSMTGNVAGVKVVLNAQNLGVGAGRNSGWIIAQREFILNIDEDIHVTAEAIRELLTFMTNNPTVGITSPRIMRMNSDRPLYDFGLTNCKLANFQGGCHFLRSKLLEIVGLNDELCTFGGEELDYSVRTRAAGFDVFHVPNIKVFHPETPKKRKNDPARRIQWLFNYSRVIYKHFPLFIAFTFSARYFLASLFTGIREHGFSLVFPLMGAALRGGFSGRRSYQSIPEEISLFYKNPALRPDLGNVPLYVKLRRRFI